MTGTAETEADEFDQIYKLDVVVIPTNRPMVRERQPGRHLPHREGEVEGGRRGDRRAAARRASRCWSARSRSRSPSSSPSCSSAAASTHEVLNAKHHEREATIVAQAGRHGAVTIATNMAGRGTDIMLGGNPEGLAPRPRPSPARSPRAPTRQALAKYTRASAPKGRPRCSRPAASTSSAPSATRRAASTTSSAAAPAARATPASRASSSRSRTT